MRLFLTVSYLLNRICPNIYTRYVQYVYGTHTTAGIPNVFIDVFGTMVQVTDNNGVPLTGPWHVNPDGTPNGPGIPPLRDFLKDL